MQIKIFHPSQPLKELYSWNVQEEMANHSSILAWRIPWMEEPGGLQSMRFQKVGHNWSDLACMQVHTCSWNNRFLGIWHYIVSLRLLLKSALENVWPWKRIIKNNISLMHPSRLLNFWGCYHILLRVFLMQSVVPHTQNMLNKWLWNNEEETDVAEGEVFLFFRA